jgi:ParB family transcriptional regulator, chromosome partitioning protein
LIGTTPLGATNLPSTREVSLTAVHVPERRVREHRHDPASLAESMREVGQLTPIILDRDLTLIAGLHRLEAARLLGWETIRAEVRDYDEMEARLAEIDENLRRHDLTVWEQSRHVAERERILAERGERARVGENQHSAGPDTVSVPQRTANLAEDLDVSEKTYQRRHKIGRG